MPSCRAIFFRNCGDGADNREQDRNRPTQELFEDREGGMKPWSNDEDSSVTFFVGSAPVKSCLKTAMCS
jgi:hypothetical protein